MKHMYSTPQYDKDHEDIERRRKLDDIMLKIPGNSQFNVDSLGYRLIRVFIYPSSDSKNFTTEQITDLTTQLRTYLGFTNSTPPKGTGKHYECYYRWERSFRETEGTFHVARYIQNYWSPNTDLLLILENAPMLNCKVVKKSKVVNYFEADCNGKS